MRQQLPQALALPSRFFYSLFILFFYLTQVQAEETISKSADKVKMQVMNKFDAGHPEIAIYKLYDPSEDVICYYLTPDHVVSKKVNGKIIYEGNTVGTISCVKKR